MKAIADPSTRENKTKHIVAGWAVIDVMTWEIPTRKTWVLDNWPFVICRKLMIADYKLLQKRIGTMRNVVVTPSTYGTDNRVTLDAMAQIGATARGVAVVDTSVADAELRRMNA